MSQPMLSEVALLRSEGALEQTGLLVTCDGGSRGRLVYGLGQLPAGVAFLTPSRAHVQRFGNVVRVGPHLIDVPFRERPIVLWEGAGEVWPPLMRSLVERVLSLLDEQSLLRLSAASKALRNAATDGIVWMHLFARRFGFLPPFAGAARGFWLSRFWFQRREVECFGSVDVAAAPPEEQMLRVVLLGPLRSGKTTLLTALHRSAPNATGTQASTFVRTSVASGFVGGSTLLCSVKFWDSKNEEFHILCHTFFRYSSWRSAKSVDCVRVLQLCALSGVCLRRGRAQLAAARQRLDSGGENERENGRQDTGLVGARRHAHGRGARVCAARKNGFAGRRCGKR
jgi:hypothetical protein